MRTHEIIKKLRSKCLPSSDDKVWKQWVDYKERGTKDLEELLNSGTIRDSLKRKAIFLLLVPSSEYNPIYWKKEVGNFYHKPNFLKTLNPDLLIFATDLIVDFHTMLKPLHCDKPTHYATGGGGITLSMSIPDKYHDALYFYNDCIMLLLALLPEEQCERIFPLFSLRDISTYCNMEESSGYNPFLNLLYSAVDEKWKKRSDTVMRQIISDELAGNTKPREEWENALDGYAYAVGLQLCEKKLDYSVDLFASQIQFLASEKNHGKELIDIWKVHRIFQILSADIYKEIRYQVAKLVISRKNGFSVYSKETMESAEMMLREFEQRDENLVLQINSAIKKYKKTLEENKLEESRKKRLEDEMMDKMK
jgi:hypothetical protein